MESRRNPFLERGEGYNAGAKAQFHPLDGSAIPFLWKAPCHAMNGTGTQAGQVCLLVPSAVLLGDRTAGFQAAWFGRFRVGAVWQLADLRYFLFKGATAASGDHAKSAVPWPRRPAVVVKFCSQRPAENTEFPYIVPKANRLDPRQATICLLPEDEKSLSQSDVVCEARRQEAFLLWKKHFWGTTRDVRFIDRLMQMTPLGKWAGAPGKTRWTKGVGFKPFHPGRTKGKAEEAWWDQEQLYYEGESEDADLVLLKSDCRKTGAELTKLHRNPDKRIFKPPLVIFNRSGSTIAFADFRVVFQDKIRSISGPKKDEDLLLFLTAVIHSDLARYFLFHTSASIAVERTTALLHEYLRLPFPMPERSRHPGRASALISEAAGHLRELQSNLKDLEERPDALFLDKREKMVGTTKSMLAPLVLDYYELNRRERLLLKDTIQISCESMTPTSPWSDVPTLRDSSPDQRRAYADYFCRTINTWAHRSSERIQAVGRICSKSGLCLLSITRSSKPKPYVEQTSDAEFEEVLKRIGDAAQEKHPGIAYMRGYYLIENEAVHVLKPLAYRHWTLTAALNDADEVMGELMFLKAAS